ncbi:hypothetical protein M1K46_19245 [Fictibacillus sp. WQ 8-8]|uniref:hypothetical protein n=1 Tax=Fictibacillus sp. WQ 8-8 TaxID=2938788 RepID=UPI00210DB5C1|nr:hypothetical protein [Fictibacillus sp. WQ 8-8]MCQ6267767.1 hypothetical protein [Fictibacillus sp. WQ 8-8]
MNIKFEYFYKIMLIILLAVIAVNSYTITHELHDIGGKIFDLTDVISALSDKN